LTMSVVFITGASRGIGQATAKKFSDQGWNVVGFYKNHPGAELARVTYIQMEITDKNSIQQAISLALSQVKGVDCLVNCAGIFGNRDLSAYDEGLMNDVMATNEKGTYWTTAEIIGKMEKGSIVNIASVAGQVGSGTDPIYAATKGAILAFSKSMAKALAPKIRVNCVSPGMVDTDMATDRKWEDVAYVTDQTPLGKMATPQDIANGIYFLASEDAGHITGACLDVSGGYVMQ
jgi:3-oxoacyl-[acyl-carrier protein] reductase